MPLLRNGEDLYCENGKECNALLQNCREFSASITVAQLGPGPTCPAGLKFGPGSNATTLLQKKKKNAYMAKNGENACPLLEKQWDRIASIVGNRDYITSISENKEYNVSILKNREKTMPLLRCFSGQQKKNSHEGSMAVNIQALGHCAQVATYHPGHC